MIYEKGCISSEIKDILGIKSYMIVPLSDIENDTQIINSFLNTETTSKEFFQVLENWGNTYAKKSKTVSLLEYINNDVDDAQRFYKFSKDWVLMMVSLNKPGYYDGRNNQAIDLCIDVAKAMRWYTDFIETEESLSKRFKYLVTYGLHRTVMQTLTEIFLRGMLASIEVLNKDTCNLYSYYGVDDINCLFKEFTLPTI